MALKNYYDILGIPQNATSDEVKKAYRKLSVKFHPDKNDGDAFLMDMFKSINAANEILSNPDKRREYDRKLDEADAVKNRSDFGQTAENHPNSFQPSPQEQEQVYNLWNLYLEKKQRADKAYSDVVSIRSFDEPRYVTTKKVLSSLLVLLLVWLFLKPTANSTATSNELADDEWVTTENANVYKKPNIQSKVLGQLPAGTKLHVLDETTYFLKVDFTTSAGVASKVYVRKSSLSRN